MCKRVKQLIKDIQNAKDPLIQSTEEIRVIIGNDDYPSGDIINTAAKGILIYDNFKIQNVAFLCDTKNLNLVSIVAILLDSWDVAIELIYRIIDEKITTMHQFAMYLATKRIILINQKGNEDRLKDFFTQYTNHKVLYIGNKPKTVYHDLVKKSIRIPHCSGQTYGTKAKECYEAYFDHSYIGSENKKDVSIADFRL